MPMQLDTADPDFETQFCALLEAKRETSVEVDEAVAAIIDAVRTEGDAALVRYTRQFDRLDVCAEDLAVSREEIASAAEKCDARILEALHLAADRIRDFHVRQIPQDESFRDSCGVELGYRWTPIGAVGLYVPGGSAVYPSSVLMNAVPARVAGVGRVVMTVPTPEGVINPLVLAAAHIAGINEIYRVGGAQAIAALAYGTSVLAPVDKIVGPGNAYVAAAKRRVFGKVGIDMIAGPSEILVVADAQNDPAWIAADLLSQAEHDPSSQSILITDSKNFAKAVQQEVEAQLPLLGREETARKSWEDFGALVTVAGFGQAVSLVNRLAPEHLEVALDDPDAFAEKIHNAGAVFLGRYTPEAIGDYVAGTNHVLPTARSARFSSGLSVLDFMKRTSCVRCDVESLKAIGPAAIALAEAEGLDAHGRSVSIRLNQGAASPKHGFGHKL